MKNILFIIVLLISLSGCKIKHKTVEKERVNTEVTQTKKVSETSLQDTRTDSESSSKVVTLTTNNNESIQAESNGSESGVQITKEVVRNKTIWTGSGVKSLKIVAEDQKQSKVDTNSVTKNVVTNIQDQKSEDLLTKKKTESSSRNTDSKVFAMNTFVSIGIGLAIIVFVILAFLYWKYGRITKV